MIKRRTLIAGGGAFVLTGHTLAALAEGLAAAIAPDGQNVRVVLVSAANGEVAIADAVLPADPSPYPLFKQFLTHKASAVAVYRAPPGHPMAVKALPAQAGAAKDLVFIAEGDTTLEAGGQSRRCAAGTFILAEGGPAYDERAGPNGYTAIKIRLAD